MQEAPLSDKELRKLVKDGVESRNFAGARQAAAKIRDGDSRQQAIKYLLVKQVGAGDLTDFNQIIELVPTFIAPVFMLAHFASISQLVGRVGNDATALSSLRDGRGEPT